METDGHDLEELNKSFNEMFRIKGKPQLVIAHTVKGKGVSFIENKAEWHGIAPTKDELEKALQELDEAEKSL